MPGYETCVEGVSCTKGGRLLFPFSRVCRDCLGFAALLLFSCLSTLSLISADGSFVPFVVHLFDYWLTYASHTFLPVISLATYVPSVTISAVNSDHSSVFWNIPSDTFTPAMHMHVFSVVISPTP